MRFLSAAWCVAPLALLAWGCGGTDGFGTSGDSDSPDGEIARPPCELGTPDHLVRGELTIKGVTRSLTLPATVMPQEDGSIKAQALFALDRTDWNVAYGSGKLFEKLGMHLVHDRIDIELFFVARLIS